MKVLWFIIIWVLMPLAAYADQNGQRNSHGEATMNKRNLAWFSSTPCQSVEIKNFEAASDKKPLKSIVICDKAIIEKLTGMIQTLPVKGEMYISFSPDVSYMELHFICGEKTDIVKFYGERIKTPGTSFLMSSDGLEREIYKYVNSLL